MPGRGDRLPIVAGLLCGAVVALAASALPAWDDAAASVAVTPLPPLAPGAVDALSDVVAAVRAIAPPVATTALVTYLVAAARARRSPRERVVHDLARVEYSGVEQHRRPPRRQGWLGRPLSFARGTGLATLCVVLLGATSGIEHEVTTGPLRPIQELVRLTGGDDRTVLVLQDPSVTFMDDSSLDPGIILGLVAQTDAVVVPFGKHLLTMNGRSGLQVSLPGPRYEALTGEPESPTCRDRTAVVDDSLDLLPGDTVRLNGVPLRVARVVHGVAQMNRSIGFVSQSTVDSCVLGSTGRDLFGALVTGTTSSAVVQDLRQAGARAAVVTLPDFRENNRDFWRANATPLLLQLIAYITLLGAFAAAGDRQSALLRNVREIGMLNATGVDFATLARIERRRALGVTLRATVLGAPLMVPVVAAFNASELGIRISVGPVEVAVGCSLTLLAMLAASQRALRQFRRSLDVTTAVKG